MSEGDRMAGLRPDRILLDARIHTQDPRQPRAEALAIRGETILATGSTASIAELAGPNTEVERLGGATVIPGLIDSHAHLDREGLKTRLPSLAGLGSIEALVDRIRALAAGRPAGEWIVTMPLGDPPFYLWTPESYAEGRLPDRHDLDRASRVHPILIRPPWGYWPATGPTPCIASSLALRLAGIDRATVSPSKQLVIERDASGDPTGVFLEHERMPLSEFTLFSLAPAFGDADRQAALHRLDAGLQPPRHHQRGGGPWRGAGDAARLAGGARRRPAERTRAPDVQPRLGTLGPGRSAPVAARLGGLAARPRPGRCLACHERPVHRGGRGRGAADPRGRGAADRLGGLLLRRLDAKGRGGGAARRMRPRRHPRVGDLPGVSRHVRGGRSRGPDRRTALDALPPDDAGRRADSAAARPGHRPVPAHPNAHIWKRGSELARAAGDRIADLVPVRRLLDAGVHTALGTDNVPISLFGPMAHLVGRTDRHGRAINPAQAITPAEALHCATVEGAWLSFDEHHKGRLSPGMLADLVVLDRDPLDTPPAELAMLHARATMTGGRFVYRRGD